MNASAAKLCRPLAQRRVPPTLQDAKYSIPWMIAFTLVHGEVSLATLNERALADPRVLEVAQRVDIVENLPDRPGHPPARITLHAADGRSWTSPPEIQVDGMSTDSAARKFADCLAYAGVPGQRAAALWERLLAFEHEPRVDFLFE